MNTQIAHIMKLGDVHVKNIQHLVLYSSWYSFQLINYIIVLPAGLWSVQEKTHLLLRAGQ